MLDITDRNGAQHLRVWTAGETIDGGYLCGDQEIAIEWRGRLGHPSSYGLLGGKVAEGLLFAASLDHNTRVAQVTRADTIWLALPDEYRPAVVAGCEKPRPLLSILVAYHGEIGSSLAVFGWLTAMLGTMLLDPTIAHDETRVWETWESCCPFGPAAVSEIQVQRSDGPSTDSSGL